MHQAQPHVTLIGVPTDVGASRLGAAMGPDALRVAQLGPALAQLGVQVHDIGNLAGPPNPRVEGIERLASRPAATQRLAAMRCGAACRYNGHGCPRPAQLRGGAR